MPLEFEWDPAKSEATFADRGIDFAFAVRVFQGPVLETVADREGEARVRAVGEIDGVFYTVIYTVREGRYRIISARRAWKNEQREFRAVYAR